MVEKMDNLSDRIVKLAKIVTHKYNGISKCRHRIEDDGEIYFMIWFSDCLTMKIILYYLGAANIGCDVWCDMDPRSANTEEPGSHFFNGTGLGFGFTFEIIKDDEFLPIKIFCNRLLFDLKDNGLIQISEFEILLNEVMGW